VRQICVPTTLSGGEFNARAGVTEPRLRLKQAYIHPGIIPLMVIFDPAITQHTPEWLWLSTGIRAVDHAVETYCSIDGNAYTDSTALQALRLLGRGLPAVKRDPADLAARLDCQIGAWISMTGIVGGTRMGASHAIGHVLGGSAGVPHGYTSCVMLPAVLAFNAEVNADRQRRSAPRSARPTSRRPRCSTASSQGLACRGGCATSASSATTCIASPRTACSTTGPFPTRGRSTGRRKSCLSSKPCTEAESQELWLLRDCHPERSEGPLRIQKGPSLRSG
jgi:hypothetical protein